MKRDINNNIIKTVSIISFLLISLSFRRFLECLFQDYILDKLYPLFRECDFDFLIFGIIVFTGLFCWKWTIEKFKNSYIFSQNELIFGLIGFLLYFLYRSEGGIQDYKFEKIVRNAKLLYFDGFFILILLYLFPVFSFFFKNKTKIDQFNKSIFTEDLPLEVKNQCSYGREMLYKNLADEIIKFNHKKSFSIAITGIWGIGKTSFLNKVNAKLPENEFIKIDFKPWYNATAENILIDFFITIEGSLNKYINTSSDFLSYGQKIANLSDSKFKDYFALFQSEKPAFDRYVNLNTILNKIDKKIVIFIDDLDRLDKKEIIEVFRLIRNAAAFDKFIFIVAFDKGYVLNAIKKFNNYNFEHYLDKIFSLEIPLVEPEKYNLFKIMIDEWKVIQKKVEYNLTLENLNRIEVLISIHKNTISKFLHTKRDIIRFNNNFFMSYKITHNLVEIEDFFLLELLKLKYSEVYKLIYIQKNKFLSAQNKINDKERQGLKIVSDGINPGDKQSPYRIVNFLLKNPKYFASKEIDNENVFVLLNLIFCDKDGIYSTRNIRNKSIVFENQFIFYFLFDSLELMNPDDMDNFKNVLLYGIKQDVLNQIKSWINQEKFKDMFAQFSILELTDKTQFENLYGGLYQVCQSDVVDNKIKSALQGMFVDKAIENPKEIIKKFYENESDYKQFIYDIFDKETDSPYLLGSNIIVNLIRGYIYAEKDSDKFNCILSKYELQKFQIKYLKLYKTNNELNENLYTLYHQCFDSIDIEKFIHLMPEANEIFRNFIIKNPRQYLNNIIHPYAPFEKEGQMTLNGFAKQTFKGYQNLEDEYEGFEKFLEEQYENYQCNSNEINRLIAFYIAFKMNNYQPIIFDMNLKYDFTYNKNGFKSLLNNSLK